MKYYKDKVVAITGGATGIGFSFAKQFGNEGRRSYWQGCREDRLQQAVEQLQDDSITARYVCCDVTQRHEVESFANIAWDAFGHVDVLINNAGTGLYGAGNTFRRMVVVQSYIDPAI